MANFAAMDLSLAATMRQIDMYRYKYSDEFIRQYLSYIGNPDSGRHTLIPTNNVFIRFNFVWSYHMPLSQHDNILGLFYIFSGYCIIYSITF